MNAQPFDTREGTIWVDGKMVNWPDAKVHILNHGLHYASSVFEGMRAYGGKIFKLTEHHIRLQHSANLLGFTIPFSLEQLNDAANAVIKANNVKDGYVRPIAWRGSERMKIYAEGITVHTAIAAWEWPAYFSPELYTAGIRLCWSKWRRPAPDTAPTASKAGGLYMICTLSKQEAETTGYHDAMMLDYRGYLAEATGANFFMIADGVLHTPIADCFLDGITRQTVIELAQRLGIEVVIRHIKPEELATAQEAFLTGTAAEITPIGAIGDYRFVPGEVTKKLRDAYQDEVRR